MPPTDCGGCFGWIRDGGFRLESNSGTARTSFEGELDGGTLSGRGYQYDPVTGVTTKEFTWSARREAPPPRSSLDYRNPRGRLMPNAGVSVTNAAELPLVEQGKWIAVALELDALDAPPGEELGMEVRAVRGLALAGPRKATLRLGKRGRTLKLTVRVQLKDPTGLLEVSYGVSGSGHSIAASEYFTIGRVVPQQLSPTDIVDVIRADMGVQPCLFEAEARAPKAAAVSINLEDFDPTALRKNLVLMRWTIRPDGKVADVSCQSEAFKESPVAACLKERIKGWTFPTHRVQGAPIDYPFRF